MANSKKTKKMVLDGSFMRIKVNTTVSGFQAENKAKECIFIQIKMYFLEIGSMAKNMEQEHTYSQQQE